jgi:hypothetical protein
MPATVPEVPSFSKPILNNPVEQGNTTRDVADQLLDALTAACR